MLGWSLRLCISDKPLDDASAVHSLGCEGLQQGWRQAQGKPCNYSHLEFGAKTQGGRHLSVGAPEQGGEDMERWLGPYEVTSLETLVRVRWPLGDHGAVPEA